jgi:exonuclease VII large subunit
MIDKKYLDKIATSKSASRGIRDLHNLKDKKLDEEMESFWKTEESRINPILHQIKQEYEKNWTARKAECDLQLKVEQQPYKNEIEKLNTQIRDLKQQITTIEKTKLAVLQEKIFGDFNEKEIVLCEETTQKGVLLVREQGIIVDRYVKDLIIKHGLVWYGK